MNVVTINKLFREYGRTLGSVESFTGGLFAREITKVSGASHFFKGALVTYASEEKNRILGISYDVIDEYGVVSKEVAAQMASNGQKLLNVDYCVSFTGNAGPTAMEGKPVGLIYIGIAIYDKVEVYEFHLSGDRDTIQNEGVNNALKLLEQKILENN
jgi:PncC family amidohydrolase